MLKSTNCLLAINNYYYRRGGAEVLFLEHNRMFENIGWQVVPFAMRHPNNLPRRGRTTSPTRSSSAPITASPPSWSARPRVIYSMQARQKHARPARQRTAAHRARS